MRKDNSVIYFSSFNSPIGTITVYKKNTKLIRIDFNDTSFLTNSDDYNFLENKKNCLDIEHELTRYFKGKLKKFTTSIELEGTAFQKNVWKNLQKIPYGSAISYKQLAKNCGSEKAFRACANANGKNPLPIVIPCHRVIYENGKMGGYSGGLHIKKQLLEIEGISLSY